MKKRSVVAAVTGIAMFATAAFAAVTFDAATGTGFVGKGDVQLAFGWNNKDLQNKAAGVGFLYEAEAKYNVYCQKTIEQKKETKVLEKTFKRTVEVSAEIAYDARVKNQITGFTLNGYKTSLGTIGADDVNCTDPHDPSSSGWEIDTDIPNNPELVEGSQTGGLFVTYNGTSVLLQ